MEQMSNIESVVSSNPDKTGVSLTPPTTSVPAFHKLLLENQISPRYDSHPSRPNQGVNGTISANIFCHYSYPSSVSQLLIVEQVALDSKLNDASFNSSANLSRSVLTLKKCQREVCPENVL